MKNKLISNRCLSISRKAMGKMLTELCDVFRDVAEASDVTGLPITTFSDGMGGIIKNPVNESAGLDEKKKVKSAVKCRVTVPKFNRAQAEYQTAEVTISEVRVLITFLWGEDIRNADRISVNIGGRLRHFEVQEVSPHSEEISVQAQCVELNAAKYVQ